MARKKVSSNAEIIDAIPDLAENEQYVIEDRTVVRKEKATQPGPITEPIPEIIEVDDVEDDEKEEHEPEYSPTSLAALVFGEGESSIDNQYCTVAIRRNPDSLNDRFLNSCHAVLTLPPMRNVELTAERSDIEETVRNLHGGGHYFFQVYFNNRLSHSWKVSLADSPRQIAEARSTDTPPLPTVTSTDAEKPAEPAKDPMDTFLDNLEKQKRMRDLLFGDELRELEELRRRAAEPPLQPVQQSETITLLEKALAAQNPTLQERLLDLAFPTKDENNSHWLVDLVKTGFEHKAELAGLLQMVLGGIAPRPQQQPMPSIESVLKQQPPVSLPPVSSFQRKRIEPAAAPETQTGDFIKDLENDITGLETEPEDTNERQPSHQLA